MARVTKAMRLHLVPWTPRCTTGPASIFRTRRLRIIRKLGYVHNFASRALSTVRVGL